jgi:unsaturated rhamnogalacturonyl hydrolase
MKTNQLATGFKTIKKIGFAATLMAIPYSAIAQQPVNDATTPLHLLQPDYPTPYGAKSTQEIKATIDKKQLLLA